MEYVENNCSGLLLYRLIWNKVRIIFLKGRKVEEVAIFGDADIFGLRQILFLLQDYYLFFFFIGFFELD